MACRKTPYATRPDAAQAVASLLQLTREHPSRQARLRPYWCLRCRTWHVGHTETPTQARARRKRMQAQHD